MLSSSAIRLATLYVHDYMTREPNFYDFGLLKVPTSPGNGLGLIQIQLDFFTWIQMDLDLIGYGYPIALDSIGLDFVG